MKAKLAMDACLLVAAVGTADSEQEVTNVEFKRTILERLAQRLDEFEAVTIAYSEDDEGTGYKDDGTTTSWNVRNYRVQASVDGDYRSIRIKDGETSAPQAFDVLWKVGKFSEGQRLHNQEPMVHVTSGKLPELTQISMLEYFGAFLLVPRCLPLDSNLRQDYDLLSVGKLPATKCKWTYDGVTTGAEFTFIGGNKLFLSSDLCPLEYTRWTKNRRLEYTVRPVPGENDSHCLFPPVIEFVYFNDDNSGAIHRVRTLRVQHLSLDRNTARSVIDHRSPVNVEETMTLVRDESNQRA